MCERIAQSVAKRVVFNAPVGLTLAVTISKNGGAFANPSGGAVNATEIGSEWYYADLSVTDTDTLGPLIVDASDGTSHLGVSYDVEPAPGKQGGPLVLGSNEGPLTVTKGVVFTNDSGDGLKCESTGGSGCGLRGRSSKLDGIRGEASAGNGHGLRGVGAGVGSGLHCSTNGTGAGIVGVGGTDAHGIVAAGTGVGTGFRAAGGATGPGAAFIGGTSSGRGMNISATVGEGLSVSSQSGHAGQFVSNGGNGIGVRIVGNGTGAGVDATGVPAVKIN